jgi:hypothetical protein
MCVDMRNSRYHLSCIIRIYDTYNYYKLDAIVRGRNNVCVTLPEGQWDGLSRSVFETG